MSYEEELKEENKIAKKLHAEVIASGIANSSLLETKVESFLNDDYMKIIIDLVKKCDVKMTILNSYDEGTEMYDKSLDHLCNEVIKGIQFYFKKRVGLNYNVDLAIAHLKSFDEESV